MTPLRWPASDIGDNSSGPPDGYVIEGDVPADAIERLLAERPEAIGLTLPGTRSDSQSMGDEGTWSQRPVMLIGADRTPTSWMF